MSEWISVETMPKEGDFYLTIWNDEVPIVARCYKCPNGEYIFTNDDNRLEITATHYMPLPERPKPTKLQWQSRTKHFPEWKDISDEMYEQVKHLAKFEFRKIEK